MVTYIYPYRNRELIRIKRSFDSLNRQDDKNFKVIFVDYGSKIDLAKEVKNLLSNYSFVKYIYTYSGGQPWNRSKAINIGILESESEYVLTLDVDMILDSSFNRIVKGLIDKNKLTYFQVGYLSKNEMYSGQDFKPESLSNHRAKGICLYPKKSLLKVNGFDEFFHCWGSEDEDIVSRLQLIGLTVSHYDSNILVYHQYHETYKRKKDKLLSEEPSYFQARFHNDKKRKHNEKENTIKVNKDVSWGKIFNKQDYKKLINTPISRTITSYKANIDFFLLFELKYLGVGCFAFKFVENSAPINWSIKSLLYQIWIIRNKNLKVKGEYSLKEINDLLLKFVIYRNMNYHLKVNLSANEIEFRIYNL